MTKKAAMFQASALVAACLAVLATAPVQAQSGALTTVSAASFEPDQPLAPESIATTFGADLAAASAAAVTVPLPTQLAGVTATVTDSAGDARNAPLFFVSPTQINFVVPAGTSPGRATLTIWSAGEAVSSGVLEIAPVSPSLFSADGGGRGLAAAVALYVAPDGSRTDHPVALYDPGLEAFVANGIDFGPNDDLVYLLLFGTGIRGYDGDVSVTVGGEPVPATAVAPQGEYEGLDQVNIGPLPAGLAHRAEVDVRLVVDGLPANVVTVQMLASGDPDELTREASNLYIQVAAKAFVWFTGSVELAYYEPVGELANYFGFAKLRNEIRDRDGPLADQGIRGASWLEALEILDSDQRQRLYDLLDAQLPHYDQFLDVRLSFVENLWRPKSGEPIDRSRALADAESMGRDEASITALSALAYGEVIASLTPQQRQAFADIRSGATTVAQMQTRSAVTAVVEREISGFSPQERDALIGVGSKLVSWLTGPVEDSVFLPSAKVANYFGFAYYRYVDRADVNRQAVANLFLDVLTDQQKEVVAGFARSVAQPSTEYVEGRAALIRGLYPLKDGQAVDTETLIQTYAQEAGAAEARRAILEAEAFEYLGRLMTDEQIQALNEARAESLLD